MGNEERLQILDMIASGQISAQQGVELLSALDEEEAQQAESVSTPDAALPQSTASVPAEASTTEPAAPTPPSSSGMAAPVAPGATDNQPEDLPFNPRLKKWQGWWRIPLGIGVIATVLTGLLMYSIYNASGFGFWFACSWFPFLLSVAILALAGASRSAHWLHVRVHQPPGQRPQNIAISFPIPLTLMAWFLRTFRSKIPKMEGVNPDEMILALHHVTPDKPFYVEVNEDDGERVEVYIG